MAESVVQPCKWESCTTKCSSDQALYEHLLKDHSPPWRKPGVEKLACGWAGCKTEPHRRWLTRHLISHTDHRPFVCGVSTCSSKGYKTRVTLEKHLMDQHILKEPGPSTVELPAQTSESLASTTSSTPAAPPKMYSLARAPLTVWVYCQWNSCSAKFADPPTLLTHLLTSHLPKSFDSKPVNYELPQTFLTTTDMREHVYPDVSVATTGPGTEKRKSKGDGEEGDAKRRRVDVEQDDSDDEQPLAKQLRALLVTEPDGDEDDIAYSDDVKDTDHAPTKATDSEDEDMNIAYEDEDGTVNTPSPSRSPSVVTTSSTAVVTPELEQEQLPDSTKSIATGPIAADERLNAAEQRVKTSSTPSFEARSVTASSTAVVTPEPDSSKPNAADERAAVEMRIQTLEQKLDAALNVIRQSEVLRAEWIGRMSESADADELEEEWNAGIVKTVDAGAYENELDDWSLWVMGAL